MANYGLPDERGRIGGRQATPREKARARVEGFTRAARYDTYVRSGMPPENAATLIGVKLPTGVYLHPTEIRRIVEQGGSSKKRI
ncbi:hypothetical protein A2715_00535 [Candidatus Woesebacteria bacterium RIFCSPHIGHO2_01_FULL_39_32]|uniref:Uncharacterized protein n=1 Tax=Candidatus Woesebacteria bacterium RIFCSPLOWO2_01_FULL_39_25 TaxID=1802521 RepID=A0A1F8BI27_9BACT|nr:MAG: hypothetical protein A2715_00535 [Candidatus Woesebacteria bacterium RIFCSPHIGHO2_01_FULL_39_32]OGM38375.1 MAG: hypothetical protein A3F01_06165 [Candidatus Woesebacteria bacterium RIFCSPHIGHO2_12_FULL_38_11]OGM63711.1 MAG: hypothetical protein A2893_01875 [Candidatus Woesebacteria bacterium RIFCSPLOWO2_01_FULL_39_25]